MRLQKTEKLVHINALLTRAGELGGPVPLHAVTKVRDGLAAVKGLEANLAEAEAEMALALREPPDDIIVEIAPDALAYAQAEGKGGRTARLEIAEAVAEALALDAEVRAETVARARAVRAEMAAKTGAAIAKAGNVRLPSRWDLAAVAKWRPEAPAVASWNRALKWAPAQERATAAPLKGPSLREAALAALPAKTGKFEKRAVARLRKALNA